MAYSVSSFMENTAGLRQAAAALSVFAAVCFCCCLRQKQTAQGDLML
jgi:hypothetical protein